MNWLVSYPKSGNTWLRILFSLAKFRNQVTLEKLVGQLADYSPWEADRKWFELALQKPWGQITGPDLLRARRDAQALLEEAHGPDAIVKSHNMVTTVEGIGLFPQSGTHRAVHLVRNPLDVAVSLKHHVGATDEIIVRIMTNKDMIARRTTFCAWEKYGSWRGHTESWLEHAPFPALSLRYEDLVARNIKALIAAFGHCNLQVDRTTALGFFDGTAIEKLRAAEDDVGFKEIPSKLKNFFRQGKTGAWKTDLSKEAREAIVADCRTLMDHFSFEY